MKMLDDLKKLDKRGLFDNFTHNLFGHSTGLLPFDYFNGYKLFVKNSDGVERIWWPNVGLYGGTFITIIGNTGVAKTTFCVQTAANIVRDIPNASVLHFDIEGSSNITRIQTLTKFSIEEMEEKYQLITSINYIEDVFEMTMKIARYKKEHKNEYMYQTNRLDEFGNPIEIYAPTIMLIDSLPMFVTRDTEGEDGMMGLTYAGRVARQITQFYQRLRPVIGETNIIFMVINHIKDKIDINPMMKSQAQIMYMKQNESMPGGRAPLYLAQNVFKFVYNGKFTEDKDGFDGFKVRCESLKSRTNKAGKACSLIYNQSTGFDPWLTLLEFIKDNELLGGRNPYTYFVGHDDFKFDSRKFSTLCEDEEFRKRVLEIIKEPLYDVLSNKADKIKEMILGSENAHE